MNKEIKNNIIEANGDIFKIFISMYDCMENNFAKEEDIKLYKKIFENLKTSEDSKIFKKFIEEKPKKIKDFYEYCKSNSYEI